MNPFLRPFRRLFLFALLLTAGAAAVAQAPIGRILVASGEVSLTHNGQNAPALSGTPLHAGDRVRTGASANAQLWFTDDSIVALRHATEFVIADYRFENRVDSDRLLFQLVRGGLRTLAGIIGARNMMGYRVQTPVAILGRRGTQYAIVACQDDCAADGSVANGLYGGVFDGRVTINNNTGESEFAAGQYFYVADLNSVPRPLLGPPSVLADRLLGLGKGVAPAAQESSQVVDNSGGGTSASSGSGSSSGSNSSAGNSGSSGGSGGSGGSSGSGSSSGSGNSDSSGSGSSSQPAPSTTTSSSTSTSTSAATPTSTPTSTPTGSSAPGTGTSGTNAAWTPSAQGAVVAAAPVAPYTGTSTVRSGGTPVAVPAGAPPTPTLGLAAAWFVTPPITYVEDPWGRTMFAAPATLQLSGSGASERLNGFVVSLLDTLNVPAQTTLSETLTASLFMGTIDMSGYDGAANVHWGRWINGTLYKSNKPPGTEVPLSGIHYIYGNPTPDTVVAAKSGSFSFNDIGGTIATDSTGAQGSGGIGAINVNFTSRTGSISTVNYTFPTATYSYSNLPFQIYLVTGAGAWMGADIASGGTCTGSGCTSPGPGNAGAVFNGLFFGSTGAYLGLSFHGSSGGHTAGFAVARLFRCSGCP